MQSDLFSYPAEPGMKGKTPTTRETSSEAARASRVSAATIRESVELLFRSGFIGTPDQAAKRLRLERHSVRSRVSELIGDKVLEPTGEKITNRESGKLAAVVRFRK